MVKQGATFFIDDELLKEFKKCCIDLRESYSTVISDLINDFVKTEHKKNINNKEAV